jgi:hypothetical protein
MKLQASAPIYSPLSTLSHKRLTNTGRVGGNFFADFPFRHIPLLCANRGKPSQNLLLLFPENPGKINITQLRNILLLTNLDRWPEWMRTCIVVCSSSSEQISVTKIMRDPLTQQAIVELWYRLTQNKQNSCLEIVRAGKTVIKSTDTPNEIQAVLFEYGIPNITSVSELCAHIANLNSKS